MKNWLYVNLSNGNDGYEKGGTKGMTVWWIEVKPRHRSKAQWLIIVVGR